MTRRPHHIVPNQATKERGFTLIEVLAAMVIFTVAILGLSHAGTESLRGAAAIEAKALGSIIADNQLTLAKFERIEVGTRRGESVQMGREFDWSLTTSETEIEGFFQITINVSDPISENVYIQRTAFIRDLGRES